MLEWWNNFAGIGGWFFSFLLDVGLVCWLLFDSSSRAEDLPERSSEILIWRVAIIVFSLLILPAPIVNKLAGGSASIDVREILSWISIVFGGIMPIATSVGYFLGIVKAPRAEMIGPYSPPDGRPSRPQANAMLVVLSDRAPAREHRLLAGGTRIGRGSGANDIALDGDSLISREQCVIRERDGVLFMISDRGSANGTFVNGNRVKEDLQLFDGDEIAVGDTKLRFVLMKGR